MHARVTRLAVLVVALSVAAAACGKYSISNIRALKAFSEANGLYSKGDYRAAIERYQEVVRHNPDFGYAYFFLGHSYDNLYKPVRKGEPENDANLTEAVRYYRLAIDKLAEGTEPKEQEIRKLSYEYLIAAYGPDRLDDFDTVVPIAKELIALEPTEPSNYQALGRLYEDQGQFDEAETLYRKAIDIRPSDPLGYQVLAGFYNRQGDFEKTMQAWDARANAEPNNPEAWHTIATYYYDKVFRDKRLPQAAQRDYVMKGLAAEDKALALNADYFEALSYKNILLRFQANFERDPAKQKALLAQADELRNRAIELQKKQGAGGGGL